MSDYARMDEHHEETMAILDSVEEITRALLIRQGIDPDAPEPTLEERRANTIAQRARNDQAHAEMRGAWRTYD